MPETASAGFAAAAAWDPCGDAIFEQDETLSDDLQRDPDAPSAASILAAPATAPQCLDWCGGHTDSLTVSAWLSSLFLDEYAPLFKAERFDTLGDVKSITEEDLLAMGVPRGHLRRILSHLPNEEQKGGANNRSVATSWSTRCTWEGCCGCSACTAGGSDCPAPAAIADRHAPLEKFGRTFVFTHISKTGGASFIEWVSYLSNRPPNPTPTYASEYDTYVHTLHYTSVCVCMHRQIAKTHALSVLGAFEFSVYCMSPTTAMKNETPVEGLAFTFMVCVSTTCNDACTPRPLSKHVCQIHACFNAAILVHHRTMIDGAIPTLSSNCIQMCAAPTRA